MSMLQSVAIKLGPSARWLTRRTSGTMRRVIVYVHRRMLGRVRVMVNVAGFEASVTPWDNFGYSLYYLGDYEPEQTRLFRTVVERTKPETFLDVGANFGYYSLIAAAMGTPKVIAFEPSPEIAHFLSLNIESNGLSDQVRLERRAVSDIAGQVVFWLNKYASNLGTGALTQRADVIANQKVEVSSVPLDQMLDEFKGSLLIKMDIEGAEFRALLGMRRILAELKPVLLIEIHPKYLQDAGSQVSQVLRLIIKDNSYSIKRNSGGRWVDVDEETVIESECWILAAPRGSELLLASANAA